MFKDHREDSGLLWRVEPICKVLTTEYGVSISRSGYYGHKKSPPSNRSIKDARLKDKILKIYEENYSCYGILKMWHALRNDGEKVARCTVARLMSELGIKGAVRGKVKRTTIAGKNIRCAEDLVRRNFNADQPNELWVADFTYISTWEGWCYSAFVIDVFARRIIGYAVSTRMNEALVENAFKMALHTRVFEGNSDLKDAIHHNDKGSQYTAIGFAELLSSHGIRASIGSVGDSYDNALAESINGSYKTELTKRLNRPGFTGDSVP